MGISLNTASILAREMAAMPRGGRVLTLGVQGVEGDLDAVRQVLAENGLTPRDLEEREVRTDDKTQFSRSLHQETFFKLLGYHEVESVDAFPGEDPDHLLDFNQPIPRRLWGQFDLVYDGGTLEHIFDVRQALANVVRLLRPGGAALHHVPVNGYVGHGFYQFSPVLFTAYYAANAFQELFMAHHYKLDGVYRCERLADAGGIPRNGIGDESLVFYCAAKTADLPDVRLPVNTHLA